MHTLTFNNKNLYFKHFFRAYSKVCTCSCWAHTKYILQGGFGGTPTADSRFAIPCPSDRNALRNPPRQHVQTVSVHCKRDK